MKNIVALILKKGDGRTYHWDGVILLIPLRMFISVTNNNQCTKGSSIRRSRQSYVHITCIDIKTANM